MPSRPKRGRRLRNRPAPRRLEDDLRRHQLAHEVRPELVEVAGWFLVDFPRVAARRVVDRIMMLSDLASAVLAWTALGAPRDEQQIPASAFAASCLLDTDPHEICWRALALSGVGREVQTHLRETAVRAAGLPTARPDPERLREDLGSILDQVRTFAQQLRLEQATSAEGLRLGRQLLGALMALDSLEAEDGEFGNLRTIAAVGLLERTLPTDDEDIRLEVEGLMRELERSLPRLVQHAAEHLEDEEDDLGGEAEDEDEEEDDEVDLEDALAAVNARLRVTEDPGDGADVAYALACSLLVASFEGLAALPPSFEARKRVIAAGIALLPAADHVRSTISFEDDGDTAPEITFRKAAGLLEVDLGGEPSLDAADALLGHLDGVVYAMQELVDRELVEDPAAALALYAASAQVLRIALQLGHREPEVQDQMAAGLGTLDPLALADLPEARAVAAQALRELVATGGVG